MLGGDPAKKLYSFCDGQMFFIDRGLLMGASITNNPRLQIGFGYQHRGLLVKIREMSDCIMHTQVFNILQAPKLGISCLKIKFGEIKNLLDVLTQYEILGFCRLG
ncbi:hypothetical protein ACFL36_02630 [Thermodesulfobacteriota bacterium]